MEFRREANRSFRRLADLLSGAQLSSSERLQSLRSVDALQNRHVESAMLPRECAGVSGGGPALLIAFLGCWEACAFARQSPLRCSPSCIHLGGPHYYREPHPHAVIPTVSLAGVFSVRTVGQCGHCAITIISASEPFSISAFQWFRTYITTVIPYYYDSRYLDTYASILRYVFAIYTLSTLISSP